MGDGAIIVVVIFFTMGVTAIGLPIAKAYARRIEGGSPKPTPPAPDITARLSRMEQAIDSIAVEVERISEGQRFTTKLLSERTTTPGTERTS
jgi:hypothetical protein